MAELLLNVCNATLSEYEQVQAHTRAKDLHMLPCASHHITSRDRSSCGEGAVITGRIGVGIRVRSTMENLKLCSVEY